ncbi:hypothetical protein COPG_00129 [Colwellia phage 9A]|uniref:Uncharacterized protein n=1 Tax=Colwellia phage 9A TaxID=765765 RepID=I3UML0_9CAUD|nr:hypothetical protein COPG_00129 [Colwellia phage 9A]AFK66725.1 hypothetical protein COPG_00129 [Colwellia phage 9A]
MTPSYADPYKRKLVSTTGNFKGIKYVLVECWYNKTQLISKQYECNCQVFYSLLGLQLFIKNTFPDLVGEK